MNANGINNGDIDGVLATYFKSQLPSPWPAWNAPPESNGLPQRRSSWLSYTRLAVAASVGVMLAAYLALAGFFPREINGRINQDPGRHIGHKAGVPATPANR
jgi:hypothetical protein